MRPSHKLTLLGAVCLLSACGSTRQIDTAPTLQALASEEVSVKPDDVAGISPEQAIAAYKQLLETAPASTQGAEASRRLGDFAVDGTVKPSPDGSGNGQSAYLAAIAAYQAQLAAHPNGPNQDQVLYQLAHVQEQSGDLEGAFKTLTQLVQGYPQSSYLDEVQFRRGELAFALMQYPEAEAAYGAVLVGDHVSPYRDRALFMQGWSRFKLSRFDDALKSFFKVLDIKLASRPGASTLALPASLGRAERELLVDTLRGVSLSLSNLRSAETIADHLSDPATQQLRESYAVIVYGQLGEYYLKLDRIKDAADAFSAYAQRFPVDVQAPKMQERAIDVLERAGFATLAVEAKKVYVNSFGLDSDFRRSRSQAWWHTQPTLHAHLTELAHYYHAQAQSSKRPEDYNEAVTWYRELIKALPKNAKAAENNFLLAEALFESSRFAEAAVEYDKAAYDYAWHPKSAEAGYAALLCYAQLQKSSEPIDLQRYQRNAVGSALRFAKAFPGDARTGMVLTDAAERLYALHESEKANSVALKVLDMKPPAADPQRRTVWLVVAHTAFDRGAFYLAEQAYTRAQELTSPQAADYNEIVNNQVAAIYKQAEQAKAAGQFAQAAGHFERLSKLAPQAGMRANALFDAGSLKTAAKDWVGAEAALVEFRRLYPQHPMQAEVAPQLALAYGQQGKWALAAAESEKVAASSKDAAAVRDALWQAGGFHEKAKDAAAATRAYERYLTLSQALRPLPLLPVLEARVRLANLARQAGNTKREQALMKEVYDADLNAGADRTERTRYLGATAALALAEPYANAYRSVALVEPLQKQLKLKKARLQEALNAYALATDPGVADVSTAATYQVASMYRDFGKAIMASQRPRKLSAVELEQYNVLLEEQASPFEEQAIAMHEVNARRPATGVYDQWVGRSFEALGEMLPVRYGKRERGDGVDLTMLPSDKLSEKAAALEQVVKQGPAQAIKFNQLGVAYRQLGKFDKARSAYERALALDGRFALAALNLGILSDLYQGDSAQAVKQYERYLALTPQGDPAVTKWVAEIKGRKPSAAAVTNKEAS